MGDTTNAVSEAEELRLRRQLEREVLPRVVVNRAAFDRLRAVCQEISEGAAPGTAPGTKKRDIAEVYRAWFEAWYRSLGFTVTVRKPNVTNREFARRAKKHQELRYEPAASEVPYEAFMIAVGQGDHWTVTDEGERAKIGWEPASLGYWYWADAQDDCPRLGTTWNDLMGAVKLLSLEEFVKHWHATKAGALLNVLLAQQQSIASPSEATSEGRVEVGAKGKGRMLDVRTWTWLRTRFGPGALDASGCGGRVVVSRPSAGALSVPSGNEGGRALDVVG